MFSDADAAALYDLLNPWDPERWPSDRFYDELVMAAGSVLDVGCGTGTMLHRACERGHTGRLVGLDPNPAALARAKRRVDVGPRRRRCRYEIARRDRLSGLLHEYAQVA